MKIKTIARLRKQYGGKLIDIKIDKKLNDKQEKRNWLFISEVKEAPKDLIKKYSMIYFGN